MDALLSQFLGYLIDLAQYVQKFLGGASLLSLNYIWLIALFLVFAVFLVGLSLGRSKILISLLCLYVAAFLEPHFIYFDKLHEAMKGKPEFWLHIGLFFIVFLACLAIFNRSAIKHSLTLRETSFFPIAAVAILEIGFLASLLMTYLPLEAKDSLPAGVVRFFGTKNAQFWWAVAPLILLLFLKHRKENPKT